MRRGTPGEEAERFGSWSVTWRPNGFSVRSPKGDCKGSFVFNRIILPVEIVYTLPPQEGYAILKLDPFSLVEVLKGSAKPDLDRFKRRVSNEVLAVVRTSPANCADCAAEAGVLALSWSGSVCPGCREYYCGNLKCLKRFRVVVLRDGAQVCKYCGVASITRTRGTERLSAKRRSTILTRRW
jgi:hypothetical protein